jgi:hypothetical protein
MIAKEKAIQLVNKYTNKAYKFNKSTNSNHDKECALICVDTILKGSRLFYIEDYIYWQEVKEEIIKLQ